MPKAVMLAITEHRVDPADVNNALAFITFRFLGTGEDLGTLDTNITVIPTDTAATVITKIRDAVIARAAEYGVTLLSSDVIPLNYGIPDTLVSAANSSTLQLTDDGVNQYLGGSLGALQIQPTAATPLIQLNGSSIYCGFSGVGYVRLDGTGLDNAVYLEPSSSSGYGIVEANVSAGLKLRTGGNANPISFWPNRTKVAEFDANGLTTVGGVQFKSVAKQTYNITNVTTDRAYNANSVTVDELADAFGTFVNDMRALGLVA